MATFSESLGLISGLTNMNESLQKSISSTEAEFKKLQNTIKQCFNTKQIEETRDLICDISAEIRLSSKEQKQFNKVMSDGKNNANNLLKKVKKISKTSNKMGKTKISIQNNLDTNVGTKTKKATQNKKDSKTSIPTKKILQGAKNVMSYADEITTANIKIDVMNDGLQSSEELQDMIFQSAQKSRTSYTDQVDTVTTLGTLTGDVFSSNQEVVQFAELANKQFKLGGGSVEEQKVAMDTLTAAMAAGNLEGNDFNSIIGSAPELVNNIADYMGKSVEEVQKMGSEGLITSDMIKNSMFASAEETNAKFADLPMTFGQLGTLIKDKLLKAFSPILEKIGKGAQFIYDNWSTLKPIFLGLIAVIGAYAAMMGIQTVATNVQTVATNIQTAATKLADKAQKGLNKSLLSNPLMWIALLIGVVVLAIIKWIKSVGGLKIAWLIAMNGILTAWDWVKIGVVTGIYFIMNFFDKMKLKIKSVSVGIQNFMGDMKVGVLMKLQDMVNDAIKIINKFTKLSNDIFGTSFGLIQEVTFATDAKMDNELAKKERNQELKDYENEVDSKIRARESEIQKMKDETKAAKAVRDAEIDKLQAAKSEQQTNDLGNEEKASTNDTMNSLNDTISATNDSLDTSKDDLEIMRELAEIKSIQNHVTLTPSVKVQTGDIKNGVDVDEVVSKITEVLETEIAGSTKEVYEVA